MDGRSKRAIIKRKYKNEWRELLCLLRCDHMSKGLILSIFLFIFYFLGSDLLFVRFILFIYFVFVYIGIYFKKKRKE